MANISPIKIIHKYKNNNRRIQYNVYIFIGSFIDKEVDDILENIKNKSLFDTLSTLSKVKMDLLISTYGDYWYQSFFNRYHIIDQFNNIIKNSNKKKTIEMKMGKEWFSKHIDTLNGKKTEYSFASNYYDYMIARNKIKSAVRKIELDYRTYNNTMVGGTIDEEIPEKHEVQTIMESNDDEQSMITSNIIKQNMITSDIQTMVGGEDEMENEEIEVNDMDEDEDEKSIKEQTQEDLDDEVVEDFNLDELTKLYSMDVIDNDKNIKDTAKLISEAINDSSFKNNKNINSTELEYDDMNDTIGYDVKIEDVYEKYYIRNELIFMDDTIKNMRNKISVSIPLNPKFGENIKLLPEYQYFWTEYNFKNTIDFVMLGQKWIRKNELVKIDIKPNDNISVYENLRNNLSYLKDSFGIKIKREDDENKILRDYEDYMLCNEIYMLDIVNELGLNYKVESDKKKNIYEVYVNIYYPVIPYERFENIIELLNNNNIKELDINLNEYSIIRNDTRLEREIYTIVEETKSHSKQYNKYFEENHIIQSIIHINLNNPKNLTGTISQEKYNLYKIFDNFIVSSEYPFIQYMTSDSQLNYKLYYDKTQKITEIDILSKWFENSTYGLSFKIKDREIENKYISISMTETGRLEYKITWKEENKATVDNIKLSYKYVFDLLLKINSENKKIKIILPDDSMFKYAFINTILKFNIPDKYRINHNDLSDFCRFFYTYISLVIEPKKRVSNTNKEETTSKFGTYLRYKRVSNYENKTKMHLRILYFLRNFEISNKELIDEISKQFNITIEQSAIELDNVKTKYNKILSKTRRNLRKLKSMPKSKPPGINIDIQGRMIDNYKIRITGARSKEQLEEIMSFIKVLIFLYIETYLIKNPKYQKIKDILLKLNKIAKRRNKVIEFVNYDMNSTTVKQITGLDKKRLGFKPEEGQSQWTRSCQNSGDDKKRRPLIVSNENIKDLNKRGYKLNTKTDTYEKTSVITVNGKKKQITVKAIKLSGENGINNYFTCDPDENAEHSYIGFLSKSNNPNDLCMPCCFKKDQEISMNKKKQNYYKKCIGQKVKEEQEETDSGLGEKLYILQDSNKIQDGRYIYLPKYLNQFFNTVWKNDNIIKNHYLIESKTGFFFKYTVKDNTYFFLSALAHIYNTTIDKLKLLAIETIEKDTKDIIFTYLNNGDIRTMFKDRSSYITHLRNSNYIEYDIMGELLALPGVINEKGIIYYIFEKRIKIVKKNLENDEYIENYYLLCLNVENYHDMDNDSDIIILIKDGKYYFPIYRVIKGPKDKKIILQKLFNKNDKMINKIIMELTLYYRMSCIDNFIYTINSTYSITAKTIKSFGVEIKKQIIDDRNKVRYLILKSGLILPTKPSGSLLDINISSIHDMKTTDLMDIDTTIKLLKEFNNSVNKAHNLDKNTKLDYIAKTLYYNMTKKTDYNITSIYLMNQLIIPIKNILLNSNKIKKYGLHYEFQPIENVIDNMISNKEIESSDSRSINVRNRIYRNEAYNLFRLELSNYLSNNTDMKKSIIGIVRNKNIKNKKEELFTIIMTMVESKAKNSKLFEIINELPDLKKYKVSNVREYCKVNKTKDKCSENLHCKFLDNSCMFVMYRTDMMDNINKIIEEMMIDGIKFKEIIMEDTYYVSDIVDHTIFSDRVNQKIIKTSNLNIKKIMKELFGKESIPQIGRKRISKHDVNIEENHPQLIELGKQLIQKIMPNQNSIIRAYVNCYYWLHNSLYDKESRNLGYFSELQNILTNLFKANIIDFIMNNINNDSRSIELRRDIGKYLDKDSVKTNETQNLFTSMINRFRKNNYNTDGIFELTILSYMFPSPIIVFDNFNNVKYIFSNGMVNVNTLTSKKYTSESEHNKTVFIKFDYEGNNNIPNIISSIYYL